MIAEVDRNKKKLQQGENLFRIKNNPEQNNSKGQKKYLRKNIKNKKFQKKNFKNYSIIDSNSSNFYNPLVKIACPVEKGQFWISAHYGIRKNNGKKEMHHGIDLAAISGTPVKASLDGIVVYAENRSGYGKCIILKHENSVETRYAHLSKIFVKNGDKVFKGDKIGLVGATGNVRGKNDPSHLHFELIINGKRYNPYLHMI